MAKAAIPYNSIGKALKSARERRGLSLQQTAEKAGIDPTLLSRMERGVVRDVKLSTLAALATTLTLSLDDFATEAKLLSRKRYIGPDGIGDAELAPIIAEASSLHARLVKLQRRASELSRTKT